MTTSGQPGPLPAAGAARTYRRLGVRRGILLAAGLVLVILCVATDLGTGPASLTFSQVVSAIVNPHGDGQDEMTWTIVWRLRMPTALLALLVGASLATAGAQMQTILNNPLASPFTLGVSAAASFGAALAIVCGAEALPAALAEKIGGAVAGDVAQTVAMLALPGSAFLFAMLCSLLVYWIGRARGGSTESIILAGVAILFLFNAGVALLQYLATENQLAAIIAWTFGSLQLGKWPWQKLAIIAAVLLISLPLILRSAWKLTALRLGENYARSLGIDVKRLRLHTLILTSVLTATAVCFAGTIGFIGLVAPHIARMLVGEDQRFFLPMSALTGATLLSAASVAGKLVLPGTVLPVGIATAFLGVPFFLSMIMSRRRRYW